MNVNFCHRVCAGTHIGFQKTIFETLKYAHYKGIYSIQFFLGNYLSLNRTKISDKDIAESNSFLKNKNLNVFTHLPYVCNLVGKGGLFYNEDEKTNTYVETVKSSIVYELNIISKIINQTNNKGGCVLHIGSIGKDKMKENKMKEALDLVVKSINDICSSCDKGESKLILETMVGRGGVIGTSFEQLSYIYNNLKDQAKERVGICIDTCHVFSEGLYSFRNIKNIDDMFNDFYKFFPKDKLYLVHLNDSEKEFNCKQDRHQTLFNGHIWETSELYYFIDKLEELGVPYVLETVEDDYDLLQL